MSEANLGELQERLRSNTRPLRITESDGAPTNEWLNLSTKPLDSVIAYEPEEVILIVQSGVRLSTIADLLAENGQWLPSLLPSERSELTIGAAIARCGRHPREQFHSPLRNVVLGGEFLTSEGVRFKSGSRVVKSVAGYDIHRAFAGSMGLLGLIGSLTLKVSAMPEVRRWFRSDRPVQDILSLRNGEGYLCEVAGYAEDAAHDIEINNFVSEVGEFEWSEAVKKSLESTMYAREELCSVPMFAALKSAFDPKGVFV